LAIFSFENGDVFENGRDVFFGYFQRVFHIIDYQDLHLTETRKKKLKGKLASRSFLVPHLVRRSTKCEVGSFSDGGSEGWMRPQVSDFKGRHIDNYYY